MRIVIALVLAAGLYGGECPVTKPPDPPFAPPVPYRDIGNSNGFLLGTEKLWVLVWASPWAGLPLWPEGYRNKVVWWSKGYVAKDDPQPAIEISGRRLDGAAAPMIVTGANGSWTDHDFIMSGVNFPTAGCWEVTGRFKGSEVKFVVEVRP